MNRIVFSSVGALLITAAAAQTPALRQGVSVQMAVTTNAVAMPGADLADSSVVTVTSSDTVFLGAAPVTSAQLPENLKAETGRQPGKRVYLKGDARTPYSTVAGVLDALRRAQVNAPILLTTQRDPTDAAYVPPKGLEVRLPPPGPDATTFTTVTIGAGQVSDAELRRYTQRDQSIVLRANEEARFGDVVHAVDVCRGEGAEVFLATSGN